MTKRFMIAFTMGLALLVVSCSSGPKSTSSTDSSSKKSASDVAIVDTFTGAYTAVYYRVGTIECQGIIWNTQITEELKSDPYEACKLNLKSKAAELDADIITVDQTEKRKKCERTNSEGAKIVEPCVWMQATAYKKN